MASSTPIISVGVLRHFRYSYYVTYWGKKVLFTILNSSFLRGECRNILEIFDDNGIPHHWIRRFFPLVHIKDLTDKSPEDLGFSVITSVCQVLWERGLNDPGDEMKRLIKRIKDERNMAIREQVEMSDKDLEPRLRGFQATLEEALGKTKYLFPCHAEIDQLRAEIQNAVPKLLGDIREKYGPSNPMDLRKIQGEMKEFLREVYAYIQTLSREELRFLSDGLCFFSPFDWLAQYGITNPCNITVSLRIEENKEFHGPHRGKIVGQNQILIIRNPNGEVPEVVIISGEAGSGKTTILCSIVESWYKDTENIAELSSFNIVLYVPFRNDGHDNFDDYLQSLLPKTVARFHLDQVKSSVIASKCLVLCDGYDEANENSEKLFRDILTLKCQGMKIVVTTRLGSTKILTELVNREGRVSINLRLLGLQKQDLELLTERLIVNLVKEDDIRLEDLKRTLLQITNKLDAALSAILQTPLLFHLFVILFIESPKIRSYLSSRTLLYLQLKIHMVTKIHSKTGVSRESLEEFDHLYKKRSLENYIQKKYEWSLEDVRRFKSEIRSPEVLRNFDAIMSSYFSIKLTNNKNLEIEKVYCYTHKSMQEFAAAGFICDEIIASSGRPEGRNGNSFEFVLRSAGILRPEHERAGKVILTQELLDVIFYIPGILYGAERNALYNVIDDIHDLYVSSWALSLDKFIDDLLAPCAETGGDSVVLKSLVSRLKETNVEKIQISQTESIFVLPSLLSRLKPATIRLYDVPKNLSELNATLQVANRLKIRTEFDLIMYLADFPEFSGRVLYPLDELRMDIYNTEEEEEQDLESLCPISLEILAKELKLNYLIQGLSGDHLVQVINRTAPMNRPEDTTDLYVYLSKEHRIKRIIDSLTVRPLRYLTFDFLGTHGDSIEDLRRRCSEKGLGYLEIEYVGF